MAKLQTYSNDSLDIQLNIGYQQVGIGLRFQCIVVNVCLCESSLFVAC